MRKLITLTTSYFSLLASPFLLLTSCGPTDTTINGYSVTDTQLYYKLLAIGDGTKKPKPGDQLLFEAVYKTQNDSIFWDSKHNSPDGYFITFVDRCQIGCFNEYFPKLVEGDSVAFMVKKEAFYKEIFKTGVPIFSEKDSVVKVNLKLKKIFDVNEFSKYYASKQTRIDSAKQHESSIMDHYATVNFSKNFTMQYGMYIDFVKRTTLAPVTKGAKVKFSYKGYYLDGSLVDYTPEGKPFELIIGEREQLLEGLQYAISLMKEGEEAKFILPSQLAFGEQGSSNGSIAPYSPLLYEVKIIKVN